MRMRAQLRLMPLELHMGTDVDGCHVRLFKIALVEENDPPIFGVDDAEATPGVELTHNALLHDHAWSYLVARLS